MDKDNANREQKQVYLIYAEAKLSLLKDNANREQKQVYLIYAKVKLSLLKDNANGEYKEVNGIYLNKYNLITVHTRFELTQPLIHLF